MTKLALSFALFLSFASLACHCTRECCSDAARDREGEKLFAAVSALEGRWASQVEGSESGVHVFSLGSGDTAVREVMFPGSEHEMTNMYTRDGDDLLLTHYCAAGNQPHMRATGFEGDRIHFRSAGVSDLDEKDELYMGEMTLVLVDTDHVEQHWRAFKEGKLDHETTFALTRAR